MPAAKPACQNRGVPGGRPTKLTPRVQERVVEAARAGGTMEDIAGYAGVSTRTLQRWQAEGEREDAEPLVVRFRRALARARAELVIELTTAVGRRARAEPRRRSGRSAGAGRRRLAPLVREVTVRHRHRPRPA